MPGIHEQLSDQFYRWEQRGRGWKVHDEPVQPEPPFARFNGHYLPAAPVVDDGRKPTFLSSFVEKLSRKLSTESPPNATGTDNEDEPEPKPLTRDALVEFQTLLPADLDVSRDSFEHFLQNLSLCREPIAFELVGIGGRVSVQFATCQDDASKVRRQLQAHFSDASFQQRDSTLERVWNECAGDDALVVEFGLAQEFMFSLQSGKIDPFVGIVGALAELKQDVVAVFQVLFQATQQDWPESILASVSHADGKPYFVNRPELTRAADAKALRPLYAAVVRIAVKSDDFTTSLNIARELAGSLRVFANPQGNELIPLSNDDYPYYDHIEDVLRRQSRRTGMLLTSDELIGFVHLPSSAVRSAALERDQGKTKAAPEIVRNTHGLLLGENAHLGETIPVRLTAEQRVYHTHIIGATGTGKSTLLFNLIQQDIERGAGVAVLDPHGDLIDRILGVIPPERIDDVVLVDPSDEEYSIGFNILSAHSEHEKTLLASDLVSVFQRLSTSWGDQMQSVLQQGVLAFLNSSRPGTLADLRRFLIEPQFRAEFLKSVSDPNVLYYWQKGFSHLSGNKSVGPILTRLEMFLAQKPVAYMVSQPKNRLDFGHIMDTGKIFLAKLPEGLLGRENSYLLGTLLISKFHQLAMARQAKNIAARRDYWIYADEFANFITPSMAEILSGARKYRIGLTLAHHELHQLQRSPEVASAVMTHPFTRVVFRVSDDDAKKLADGFSFFDASNLKNLETGHAIARVQRSNFDFNLSVILPVHADETDAAARREEVITGSRKKYGTPRAEVEAMLRQAWDVEQIKTKAVKSDNSVASPKPQSVPVKPADTEPPKTLEISNQAEPDISNATDIEAQKSSSTLAPEQKIEEQPREDKGIGGHQHNLIRERIEETARQLGYTTSREHATGSGGKVDVVLEKPERSIACEIAITTTIDHEVGNVAKCLKAGFKHVAVISPGTERLQKIETAVRSCVPEGEMSRVRFYVPEAFLSYLRTVTTPPPNPASNESQIGKYKVKRSVVTLTDEEVKAREAAALKLLSETMRKKKQE
jgi:hypothetical protein